MVSDVTNDPQRMWPYFRGENSPTVSSVPFTFRDGITTMEKMEQLAHMFKHLIEIWVQYQENMKDWADDTQKDLADEQAAYEKSVNDRLDNMLSIIQGLYKGVLEYNPTTGAYENTQKVQRDMFRDLAVFGARVDQMATLTCEEAAKHTAQETSVIGNVSIFGNTAPRVTPVSGGEQS